MTAGGREPLETQEISNVFPAERGLLGLVIRAVKGRTKKRKMKWVSKVREDDNFFFPQQSRD